MNVQDGTPGGILIQLDVGSYVEQLTRKVAMEEEINLRTLRNEYVCVKDKQKLQPSFQFFESNSAEDPVHYIKPQGKFQNICTLVRTLFCHLICRVKN